VPTNMRSRRTSTFVPASAAAQATAPRNAARRRGSRVALVFALVTALLGFGALPAVASPGQALCRDACVTTHDAKPPGEQTGPFGITAGPLSSEWFGFGDRIGRIDQAGKLTTYDMPSTGAAVGWLTRTTRNTVWFVERDRGILGRITVLGGRLTTKRFLLPSRTAGPHGLVQTPDGAIWVTEQDADKIARLDPKTRRVREFPVPSGDPLGLTLGPDGALWFIMREPAKVGRMSLSGEIREWSLAPGANPNRIAVGPDGAVWFTELGVNRIGRITMRGRLTEFPVEGGPVGITAGRDGALYVVLANSRELAMVDLSGRVTGRWTLPGADLPLQVATGQGRDIWVTDGSGGHVYRVTPYE